MKKSLFLLIFVISFSNGYAQFNTIQKTDKKNYVLLENNIIEKQNSVDENGVETTSIPTDAIEKQSKEEYRKVRKKPKRRDKKTHYHQPRTSMILKGLNIYSLYQEILNNNIHHPKIVLAQAILETGWFKSSVCRNKGNLFGLTNPRTGEYYEFSHWKESVKAYKDKVQYKYKGGNYLLWLQNIGYAEDPRYVSSLIKLLEQYFI